MTPEERRAVLERAFPGVFSDARAGDGAEDADGGAKAGAGGVPSIPRGRLGAVGEPRERDRAFERWVREPPSAPYVDDDETSDDVDDRSPFVGSVVLRSVFGRGRGLVTSARVEKGETLMSLPLLKCMSTASARRSKLAPALAELAANATEMTIDAVLALHLLHELHVQGEESHWWPYVSALPKDVGSPLLWAPKELAQLEGSNLVGFRDAVLRGWMAERETLFPKLTNAFPETFPEQHFRAANWAWAMSIVWSRAAHVPVAGRTLRGETKPTILALVPLFDMINHGYARGAGSGSRPALNDAPAVSISFVESRGEVVVSAGDAFGGPGEEIRFNYGEKPSQYVFLQYGFVPRFNPDECVEVAPRMSKKDPLRRRKREVLASHDLSPNNRNFHFYPNRLDRDLLAATRVQVMTETELDDPLAVASAVAGGVVSERNEAVTRATLLKAAHELLLRYPTTLAEDLATMDKFLDENPYDPVFGAEKRRTGDAPAIPAGRQDANANPPRRVLRRGRFEVPRRGSHARAREAHAAERGAPARAGARRRAGGGDLSRALRPNAGRDARLSGARFGRSVRRVRRARVCRRGKRRRCSERRRSGEREKRGERGERARRRVVKSAFFVENGNAPFPLRVVSCFPSFFRTRCPTIAETKCSYAGA
jgi:histone-lysine N-methyltransferase SETD3